MPTTPSVLRRFLCLPLLVALAVALSPASAWAAGITVTPLTWDVIGIKHNNAGLTSGPHLFPVGAKVCNGSGGALTGVQASITLGTGNTAITLDAGAPSTDTIGSLADGECTSTYYTIDVVRAAGNRLTNREYSIDATSTEGSDGGTGTRKLYVQALVDQNRNTTQAISGPGGCNAARTVCDAAPTNLAVGSTYTYKLYAKTSTGYEQLESFLTFPGGIFRIENVQAEYQIPSGASFGGPYADACGWTMNGALANFGSCTGPIVAPWASLVSSENGKAGGQVVLTYTVKVIGSGSGTLDSLIYDFSGSSFHYNADYGEKSVNVTASTKYPLDVTVNGSGQVASDVGGIQCGTINVSCAKEYDENTVVTLTATEDGTNEFNPGTSVCPGTGWTLASGTGSTETYTCAVTMDASKSAVANFDGPSYYPLTVAVTGSGGVTSDDTNINCTNVGGSCGYGYAGNVVVLTATPGAGSAFNPATSSCPVSVPTLQGIAGGWVAIGGGVYTCTTTVDMARHATAVFDAVPITTYPLTAAVNAGQGSITSSPSGIDCNQDGQTACDSSYDDGTVVTLTATPAAGQRFLSGSCPGTGWTAGAGGAYTCTVTMSQARSASASFELVPAPTTYPLTVTVNGSGTVAGSGINCATTGSADCSKSYDPSTVVTLTATPAAGYRFDTGSCPGTGWAAVGDGSYTCAVTMDAAKDASATFVKLADPRLRLTVRTSRRSIPNGQTVKVTGTLKNIGELQADNTRVCLTVPKGFVLVSYGKGGKRSGNQVCWSLGSLDPDKSKDVWMKLRAVRDAKSVAIPGTATASNAKSAKGKAKVKVKVKPRPRPKPPTG